MKIVPKIVPVAGFAMSMSYAPVKALAERRLIGRSARAIDIPSKTNGTGRYGIDAEIGGMVHARPKVPPTLNGSKVVSVEDSGAKHVKGYIRSVVLEDPSGTVLGWVRGCATSRSGLRQFSKRSPPPQ